MAHAMKSRAGFTLIETLAALAITAVIILATGAMLYQNVFFFDRGTRNVDQSEQLALAIDCLARDFGAARFVVEKTDGTKRAAFVGTAGNSAKVLFVTGGGKASGPQGEEVVSISVETHDDLERLVRRRVAWPGPRVSLEAAKLGDPVILLKGKITFSFSFSELAADGSLTWHDHWTGEQGMPHSVRLNMRNADTGADIVTGAEFPVHADAPASCIGADTDCLSLAAKAASGATAQPGAAPAPQAVQLGAGN